MSSNYYSRTESSKDRWETPKYFFKLLDDIFHFTLDAAASDDNHLCPKYFTRKTDGLKQSWAGERVFVNPPFSQAPAWIEKAFKEGKKPETIVVLLTPSRTETKIWHRCVMKAREIWLCFKRVNFNIDGERGQSGATFPLAVIIFEGEHENPKLKAFHHR